MDVEPSEQMRSCDVCGDMYVLPIAGGYSIHSECDAEGRIVRQTIALGGPGDRVLHECVTPQDASRRRRKSRR